MDSIGSVEIAPPTTRPFSVQTASTGVHQFRLSLSLSLSLVTILSLSSDYLTAHHSQEHEMVPQTVPTSSSTADEDYMYFPQNSEGKYNYLDPNFYPAS